MSEMSTRQHTKRSAVEPTTTATTIDRQTTEDREREGRRTDELVTGNWSVDTSLPHCH